MTNKTLGLGIGLCGLVALGCNARTMIGDLPDGSPLGSTLGAGGSGTCMPLVDQKDQAFTPPAGVAGTWTGYFQGSNLAVGQDAIKLTIDQAPGGSNQIHIVFGTNPPPPPATVATDLYPPGTNMNLSRPSPPYDVEGFSYPGHEVQWDGERLRFGINNAEAWDSWCKLQQSYWTQQPGSTDRYYRCVPGSGVTFTGDPNDGGQTCTSFIDDQTTLPVDCDQAMLSGACQCDECGCAAPVEAAPNFDITFAGDVATGTGATPFATSYLRLTRSAN